MIKPNRTISDWTVIILGIMGLLLGISGLLDPVSQYKMLGIQAAMDRDGLAVRGLLRSGSVSAIYVGGLYLLGVWKQWTGFKQYLVLTRLLMTAGFAALYLSGPALPAFQSAAAWEAGGAVLIGLSLLADQLFNKNKNVKPA